MAKIQRAIISLSDKTGIQELARSLQNFGVEILSTGGTAKVLRESGLKVMDVSEYTGFPEMLDGRVKTLHPKVHGGLLGIRDNPEHSRKMKEHGIQPIDMVVINLYPFEATVAKSSCTLEDAIENIDIGGPAMIRAPQTNTCQATIPKKTALIPAESASTRRFTGREKREERMSTTICPLLRCVEASANATPIAPRKETIS